MDALGKFAKHSEEARLAHGHRLVRLLPPQLNSVRRGVYHLFKGGET